MLIVEHIVQEHNLFMILIDLLQHSIGILVDRHDLFIGYTLHRTLSLLNRIVDGLIHNIGNLILDVFHFRGNHFSDLILADQLHFII